MARDDWSHLPDDADTGSDGVGLYGLDGLLIDAGVSLAYFISSFCDYEPRDPDIDVLDIEGGVALNLEDVDDEKLDENDDVEDDIEGDDVEDESDEKRRDYE